MTDYDIAVIGGGPGGYVAAIKAAKMGAKTALFESDELGGVCLNRGCIPTKTIISSVNLLRTIKNAGAKGISIDGDVKIDFQAIIARKNKVVAGLVKGIHQLIKANKIDYYNDHAEIQPDRSIRMSDGNFTATNIIIATGSRWKEIRGLKTDSEKIVTSDDMLNLNEVPKRLAIVGGGVIGCEFASIFSSLGSEVTIIEAMDEILPMEDSIVSKLLRRSFKKEGISVLTGVSTSDVKKGSDGLKITLTDGKQLDADILLVSIGRVPKIDNCIEELGIKIENGAVKTDLQMRTNIDGIYAIGDVNGKYMLAHVASEEGIVAVENIMGNKISIDYEAVPRPVYTYPEILSLGATAKELEKKGIEYTAGTFSLKAASKAICDAETDGEVVIFGDSKSKKILGAAVVGSKATEFGSELALAIRTGLKTTDVAGTIHSHPTLSEVVKEAAEDCDKQAIHKVYVK